MEQYDYREAMKDDIREYIEENYDRDELPALFDDEYDFRNQLEEDLWIEDSVTGNASGSYFFSTWKAEEALCHNLDLLKEALENFADEKWLWKNITSAETLDVTIRCHLLYAMIEEVVEEEGYFA